VEVELAAEGRLREIPAIGASLEALIREYLETGAIRTHARLVAEHPPGLAPLLLARGFGPAGIHALYQALGVTDLDALERAAQEGRLAEALGPKRAEDLVAQLPALRNPIRRVHLKGAWEQARQFIELLRAAPERPRVIEVSGDARRMCELIVSGVDLVALAGDVGVAPLLELVERLPGLAGVLGRTANAVRLRLYDGLELRLHVADEATFGAAQLWCTGSAAHLARLQRLAADRGWVLAASGLREADGRLVAGATEHAIYERLGLPWIAPELREDQGEIDAARAGQLPRLVDVGDLKGDLHCHTNWTDGSATLDEMARAARARGYDYMALTDHSRSLQITNGLSIERLEEARRHVQRLNQELAPFVVLLGTEMDILEDGALDYPDEVLASLDYVSASVHSRFKQPSELMTPRIERAVTHPLVHTLNHPHGRLLTVRPAYAVEMERVIAACARAGCALEVSADPARMDLDGGWARRARELGALCTVSSDAHSTLDYDNIWLGVGSARRGWLEPAHVVNTRGLAEMRTWLRRPRGA
jgi:DNA polymerase (family 10)